jgi:regulator of nonsense transcripts 1
MSPRSSGVAKVAELHGKWARGSPMGALCSQCQELNALHSQSVDGARIKIPDRLRTPPAPDEPYIIDLLGNAAKEFAERFTQSVARQTGLMTTHTEDAEELMVQLLQSKQNAVSEYELFNMAFSLARKHDLDIRPHLVHVDFGALSAKEKDAISSTLKLTSENDPYIWNSLVRSDILTARDLYQKELNRPYALQRLYSSRVHGLATFFVYLRMATQDFTRKLLIIKVC